MVFEHIEQLKSQFTDKYVVVDDNYPELQRFRGRVGAVKTVNMSGRALVQFEMDNNIGWYDIDLAFLKVVDPPPQEEAPAAKKKAEKSAEKPADKPGFKSTPTKSHPAAEATEKPIGEVKKAPAAAKSSTADILAAARSKAGAPAAKAEPAAKEGQKSSVEDILAAARREKTASAAAPAAEPSSAAPAAAKPDPKKMSVAEMLAAARAEKQPGAAPAAAAAPAAPKEKPVPAPKPAPEPVAAAPEPAAAVAEESADASGEEAAPAAGGAIQPVKLNTVEEMLAYCRRVDAQK